MADFDFVKPAELEFTEPFTVSFAQLGNDRKWKLKYVNNLSPDLDDRAISMTFEALIGEVVDEEQADFRKFFTPLYVETKVTLEQVNELFKWIQEERERLTREATEKLTSRPTSGQ